MQVDACRYLFERVIDTENKQRMLQLCLSEHERVKLESLVGVSSLFDPQNPTGHYELNLSKKHDLSLFREILRIAANDAMFAKNRSFRADISQRGNWEGFRNCTFRGTSFDLHSG